MDARSRRPQLAYDCGTYRELHFSFGDASEDDYYDAASGSLVAVIFNAANAVNAPCAGGPASFAPPLQCQPALGFCG